MSNIVDLTDDPGDVSDIEEVRVVRLPTNNDVEVVSSRRVPRDQRRQRQHFDDMPSLGGHGLRDIFPSRGFEELLADASSQHHSMMERLPRGHLRGHTHDLPHDLPHGHHQHSFDLDRAQILASRHPHPFYGSNGFNLGFLFPPGHGQDQDNPMMQHVLARSLQDTHNHQAVNWEKVRKPPMDEVSPGFTRDLNSTAQLCCPRCMHELGTGDELHAKVFFRSCGHCYCGGCVEEVKALKGKRRACSAEGCRTKKRIFFKQIYF